MNFTSKSNLIDNCISVKDAAEYSVYSTQYLRRLLRLGKLAGLKVGQLWLVDKTAYEAYLKNAYKTQDRRFGPKNYRKSGVKTLMGDHIGFHEDLY